LALAGHALLLQARGRSMRERGARARSGSKGMSMRDSAMDSAMDSATK
jgi:hypothetical protein